MSALKVPSGDHPSPPRLHPAAFALGLSLCILLLSTAPVDAAEKGPEPASKLKFMAYLTQAYAETDEHDVLGITDDGVTDYRDLAIQFRYAMSKQDQLVVQLEHSAKGESLAEDLRDDIAVDWAYYQRTFGDQSALKVGRIPIPIGIYNELRDVGTVLPFFAPAFGIYNEGTFTSETVDGVAYARSFLESEPWSLDLDLYYGSWEFLEGFPGLPPVEARAEDALGARLWINTPLSGVRFGISYSRFDATEGILRIDQEDTWTLLFLSLDATFERFTFQAEYLDREAPLSLGTPLPDNRTESFYAYLGVSLTERLRLNVQYDTYDLRFGAPLGGSFQMWDDLALGLSYAIKPNLVIKAEYHDNETYFIDDMRLSLTRDPPAANEFFILSLSVSVF